LIFGLLFLLRTVGKEKSVETIREQVPCNLFISIQVAY
jgi:hypothetical protein